MWKLEEAAPLGLQATQHTRPEASSGEMYDWRPLSCLCRATLAVTELGCMQSTVYPRRLSGLVKQSPHGLLSYEVPLGHSWRQ